MSLPNNSLDHLAILQHDVTKKYHGGYYRNKPTPSGCVRFILQCSTTTGYDTPEEAAAAIEKAFPNMPKIKLNGTTNDTTGTNKG